MSRRIEEDFYDDNRHTVRDGIRAHASADAAFLVMNALAAVVASYGLFSNSAAVVIGAMIIATLLGPIMGIALALVDGNSKMLRSALFAEVLGMGLVLLIAILVGWIHRNIPLTAEILARTRPNVLDLMIALGGGAAGAYATASPKVSAGIVGVAISTALVPPLATCGICLARGEGALAWGGFLLFLANLVAIQFASSVVLWLHGFHDVMPRPSLNWTILRRNIPSFGILLVLGVSLTLNFKKVIAVQTYQSQVQNVLGREFREYPGVQLADLWIEHSRHAAVIMAVVRTPYSFTPDRVKEIEALLPRPEGKEIELHIRAVLTKEATAREYLHEPIASEPEGAKSPQGGPARAATPNEDSTGSGSVLPEPSREEERSAPETLELPRGGR